MPGTAYVRVGPMRHRAKLQQRSESSDGQGGVTYSWVDERDLWCQIRPLSGNKRIEAAHRQSEETHEIYARWAADITPKKRITHDGQVYRIKAVWSPGERKQFVHIVASNTMEAP